MPETAIEIIDKVTEVNFFPFKGAHAATVNGLKPISLQVGRRGFEVNGVYDRDLGLYDPASNRFVTQRGYGVKDRLKYPSDRRLATLQVDIQEDHIALFSVAGHLELPLTPVDGTSRRLDIWGRNFPVIEQRDNDTDHYFRNLMQREVWLMRADREKPSVISERHWRDESFNEIGGADNLPLSMLNQASLDAQHQRNGFTLGAIPIDRYRGGIIVSGYSGNDQAEGTRALGPFGEDFIDPQVAFNIGEINVWAAKAISRCTVTEVDQETGELGRMGLRVLRGRAGSIPGETGVFFGERLVHSTLGTISVGDEVVIPQLSSVPNLDLRQAA